MDNKKSLDVDYFKKVYAANDDPWNFETSEYEADKYAATISSIPRKSYENVLEIGCSIGVLTRLLAERSERLLATDVSEKALEHAVEKCGKLDNVYFQRLRFPADFPDESFDLIMISEVAYYLSPQDWENAIATLYAHLNEKGNIVLVHWLPVVHDYPQTGDEVHQTFEKLMKGKMTNVFNTREENYRIDVWEKADSE